MLFNVSGFDMSDPAGKTNRTSGQLPTRRVVLGGGLISLAVWLASYRPTPDPSWTSAAKAAPWPRRDGAGFVAHQNRVWLIGGTDEDGKTGLTDCWSSADGLTWTRDLDRGPWTPTVHSMVASFSGRLWRMGGLLQDGNTFVPVDDIWSSADGQNWTRAVASKKWSPRGGGTLVAFDGRLWLLGGVESLRTLDPQRHFNDVWFTEDGTTWIQALDGAPWRPRAFHNAVVHDGKLWILGGGYWADKPAFFHDVWCSRDGIRWESKTIAAEWSGRLWAASTSFRGRLWTMGGLVQREATNDIWYSNDGETWYPYLAKKVWTPRMALAALAFADKLWVVAGSNYEFFDDVWVLSLPPDWNGSGFFNRTYRLLRWK